MKVFAGPIGLNLLGNLDQRGLKGLSIWHDGPVYVFTKGAPAVMPEKPEGQKMRVAPSKPLEMMLGKAGATSISMPATEVYLALQQSVANGVVSTPTYAAPARWGEVLTLDDALAMGRRRLCTDHQQGELGQARCQPTGGADARYQGFREVESRTDAREHPRLGSRIGGGRHEDQRSHAGAA